jgi:hypothetical protein
MMKNRPLWFWVVPLVLISSIVVLFSIEESRTFLVALLLRMILFIKKNILTLLAAFFLVKGKFILNLFLKKILLLSATGLGKRYMIERVLTHNFKIHFLNHLNDDIKRLIQHAKENFYNYTLVKKIITVFTFIGSLGFVGKFMGGMLALKVFAAKVWSFLLVIFLKVGTAVVYFFTDYLWGSWLAPIVEVVIFSWLLSWMEKVPYLNRWLRKIYAFLLSIFGWMEYYIEKVFHIPLKRILKWLVKKIQSAIHNFIGYERVSLFTRLKEVRKLNPNAHVRLLEKRKEKDFKKKLYISSRERLKEKRKERKKS